MSLCKIMVRGMISSAPQHFFPYTVLHTGQLALSTPTVHMQVYVFVWVLVYLQYSILATGGHLSSLVTLSDLELMVLRIVRAEVVSDSTNL